MVKHSGRSVALHCAMQPLKDHAIRRKTCSKRATAYLAVDHVKDQRLTLPMVYPTYSRIDAHGAATVKRKRCQPGGKVS